MRRPRWWDSAIVAWFLVLFILSATIAYVVAVAQKVEPLP